MYRRIVDKNRSFVENVLPNYIGLPKNRQPIYDSFQLEEALAKQVEAATKDGKAAIALSGGIDSAILAKMMPKGSTAYTFRCLAPGKVTVDETEIAAKYAKECGLKHKIIDITWEDMEKNAPKLMFYKKTPIHSIEVQIYMGGCKAIDDGYKKIIYGETADVSYGGLSKILARDWRFGEFAERYAYLKPWMVLKNPKVDFSPMLPYLNESGFMNTHDYLATFDILESINSYINACEVAGIEFVAPYMNTYLAEPLDIQRVRAGENKYLIREIFARLYPNWEIPEKLPMPRAVDQWLLDWSGPKRSEFLPNCVELLTGDQKWLCWSLEEFLNIIEEEYE